MAGKLSKKARAELADRKRRMAWWHEARFGMFVHWGLYSVVGRHEWVQNNEQIPRDQYEALARKFKPKRNCARQWAKLAKKAGMKYMVLTTKHHEGYCLWDTATTDYNAAKTGPGRDLVAEYVAACRGEGLKVGFYFSMMDWHHRDGFKCCKSEPARKRFVKYIHAQVRELMTKFGAIDVLWYDVSYPLNAKTWESAKLNRMVRKLQPDIVVNDRSQMPEDFGTPEESIVAAGAGRAWEACMTFNGSWGWVDTTDDAWHGARDVVLMLRQCVAGGGNLLLNIGPKPDGSVPVQAVERLTKVGKWMDVYGKKCVYGPRPRSDGLCDVGNMIVWTRGRNPKRVFAWCNTWPNGEVGMGWFKGKVKRVKLLTPQGAKPVKFTQTPRRLVITGLPKACPDKAVGIAILQIDCASRPTRKMGIHTENAVVWWGDYDY
ncbi:hypothetical protein LCGC14_0321210 [marine sediment metagenome]|uniref:alpha-L-fucosidase n=1 Tax=marine sediment metagenome TaxID=412755 RepID=A0A0F9TPR2_9ZZZZ|nr:alpha-L-fucosidase [Phycisphaerae bacterium]HDZ43234.1 alpha-L-fucosidase [Phycisphaerae bacterium]